MSDKIPALLIWVADGYASKAEVEGSLALKADLSLLDGYQPTGSYLTQEDLSVLDSYATLPLTVLDGYQPSGSYLTQSSLAVLDSYAVLPLTVLDGYQVSGDYLIHSDLAVLDSYAVLPLTVLDGYQVAGDYLTQSSLTVLDSYAVLPLTVLDGYQVAGDYLIHSDLSVLDSYATLPLTILDGYQPSGSYLTQADLSILDSYAVLPLTVLDGYTSLTDFNDHSARHESGGADAIKLDDLAAPDNNTDLDATTLAHGLLPMLSGSGTQFLDGTGNWSLPAGGGGGDSYQAKVSSNDTTFGYLEDKIIGTGLLGIATLNDGGDESLQISVDLDGYQVAGDYLTQSSLSVLDSYAVLPLTILDGYAEEQWVTDNFSPIGEGGLNWNDIDGYALTVDVNNALDLKADLTLLDGYLSSAVLDGYASEQWVTDNFAPIGGGGGGLSYSDIDGYATKLWVEDGYEPLSTKAYLNAEYGVAAVTTTITTAFTYYQLNFDNRLDQHYAKNMSITGDGVISFPIGGVYSIRVTLYCAAPAAGRWYLQFKRRNGTSFASTWTCLQSGVYMTNGSNSFEWIEEMPAGQDGYLMVTRNALNTDTTFEMYNGIFGITKIDDI